MTLEDREPDCFLKDAVPPSLRPAPLRIDLGCGKRAPDGWMGADISDAVGATFVLDLTEPWPWKDGSVDEMRSSHFFEHLHPPQRIHFMNEAWRCLKPGATIQITTPLGYNRQVQDPDHKWPPIVPGSYAYFSRDWLARNDLQHYETRFGIACNFEIVQGEQVSLAQQYRNEAPRTRELLMMADPDAQTDLRVTLRRLS